MTYTQYIFHENNLICQFKTKGDSLDDMFRLQAKTVMENAIREHNVPIYKQINTYIEYCKVIEKKKLDCFKVRTSDLLLYATCFSTLVKFGIKDRDDCIFLKDKKKR